jgi:OmpA-OmpF porin, OOP family
MSKAKYAWLGLVPLLIIWLVGTFLMTDRVESELRSRSSAAIAAISPVLDVPGVAVAGRDAALEGTAFSSQALNEAVGAVDRAQGVRLVRNAVTAVPHVGLYTFEATRDGDRLILSGNVPQPKVRMRIIEAAKALAADVVDNLTYAQGAPDGFEAIAIHGLIEVTKLRNGAFALTGKAYSISGRAPTTAIFESALAASRQLPAGAIAGTIDITSNDAEERRVSPD